jgi:hypothetical protein
VLRISEVTDVEGKTGIIVADDDKLCPVKYADGEIYRWILWNLRPAAADPVRAISPAAARAVSSALRPPVNNRREGGLATRKLTQGSTANLLVDYLICGKPQWKSKLALT